MTWREDQARGWHGDVGQPVQRIRVRDRDLPRDLIGCGLCFASITWSTTRGSRRLEELGDDSYLAFDPDSEYGRLYLILSDSSRFDCLSDLYTGESLVALAELAAYAGGRQQDGYPDVLVEPLGAVIQVEYVARKYLEHEADEGAVFHHEFEEPLPWLAVDARGRLWIAGGDYVGDNPAGITG